MTMMRVIRSARLRSALLMIVFAGAVNRSIATTPAVAPDQRRIAHLFPWWLYLADSAGGTVQERFFVWMNAQYGPTWPHWMAEPVVQRHWRHFVWINTQRTQPRG